MVSEVIFFTGAIDHTPQFFYGRFRALAWSLPFPDLHCFMRPFHHSHVVWGSTWHSAWLEFHNDKRISFIKDLWKINELIIFKLKPDYWVLITHETDNPSPAILVNALRSIRDPRMTWQRELSGNSKRWLVQYRPMCGWWIHLNSMKFLLVTDLSTFRWRKSVHAFQGRSYHDGWSNCSVDQWCHQVF
jgi:hypothetical protein